MNNPTITAYTTLVRSRLRSAMTYRASFALEALSALAIAAAETAELLVYFHNVTVFGGLRLPAALMLLALSFSAFTTAFLIGRNVESISELVRTGILDTWYTRPMSILGQALTYELLITRAFRLFPSAVMFAIAWAMADVPLTANNVGLLVLGFTGATLTALGLCVLVGSVHLLTPGAQEAVSVAFFATNYVSTVPQVILPPSVRWLFFSIIPIGLNMYLPVALVTGTPLPSWLPAHAVWLGPVWLLVLWVVALSAWRFGVARYNSAGG